MLFVDCLDGVGDLMLALLVWGGGLFIMWIDLTVGRSGGGLARRVLASAVRYAFSTHIHTERYPVLPPGAVTL